MKVIKIANRADCSFSATEVFLAHTGALQVRLLLLLLSKAHYLFRQSHLD